MTTPPLYYANYLQLHKILNAQEPESSKHQNPIHDEMLFIIVHQTYELWFKQILFELDSILHIFSQPYIPEEQIALSTSRLRRIVEIQKLLIQQIHVLETMTPMDFLEFRNYLFPASGFQSYQFRLLELKLGLSRQQKTQITSLPFSTRLQPEHEKLLQNAENQPNLLQLVQQWLERIPFLKWQSFEFWKLYQNTLQNIWQEEEKTIQHNPTLTPEKKQQNLQEIEKLKQHFYAILDEKKYQHLQQQGLRTISHKATQAALLIYLYRDQPILQMPFQFLNLLVDIDEQLTTWRYRHALMAARMIGTRIGTGGSSGYQYLKESAEKSKIFTDLANLSSFLIPRSKLPPLPKELIQKLGFHFQPN